VEQGIIADSPLASSKADRLDAAAFEAFYASTAPALHSYIRRVAGDAASAEDILQEAFCRFLRCRHGGMEEAQMRSYLYRTATTIIYDQWRRRRVVEQRRQLDKPAVAAPADPSGRLDMERALGELAPRERALVWLAYVEGASHAEIAAALGLSALSVRVLLFRARRKLARLLRQEVTT
jgi:RNA polymerase sigma-70 factor (ECF subfamily)